MKKTPLLFIYFLFIVTFAAVPPANAYDAYATHPILTNWSVNLYNQKFTPLITEAEKRWLEQGSIDEDDDGRCLNHFYDPVYHKSWQLLGSEAKFPVLTAPNWAQNPFAQAVYDPLYYSLLGPVVRSPVFSRTNYTWQRAIYEYVKGHKKKAFIALGHILHLIQDMSVPEHTRQNVHIFLLPSATSPLENYAK